MLKQLGKKHFIAASRSARTNGAVETQVKRFNELVKRLCECDSQIESMLSVFELILNTTTQAKMRYSPFEIIFGHRPRVCEFEELKPAIKFSGDYETYMNVLRNELENIRKTVYADKVEMRQEEEKAYNRQYKVKEPSWSVGQVVLLSDKKVKPNSDVVLSHRPFFGPFYVAQCVKGQPHIGMEYKLVDVKTGRVYPYLVSGDRLKPYDERRIALEARLSQPDSTLSADHEIRAQAGKGETEEERQEEKQQVTRKKNPIEPAIRVIKERKTNGRPEFLVLFADNSLYWADLVSPLLLKEWRLRKKPSRRVKR